MSDAPREYLDQLPVTEEWAQEHEGEAWSFDFPVNLGDLVWFDGMDGLNNHADAITGIVLSGIDYKPIEVLDDGSILVRATGTVELF